MIWILSQLKMYECICIMYYTSKYQTNGWFVQPWAAMYAYKYICNIYICVFMAEGNVFITSFYGIFIFLCIF